VDDFTPAERTLLRHMALRHPEINLASAAEETGLPPEVTEPAMRSLCEVGLVEVLTHEVGGEARPYGVFKIVDRGKRIGLEPD
jgi:predicted ArsR family transcriptional regulator